MARCSAGSLAAHRKQPLHKSRTSANDRSRSHWRRLDRSESLAGRSQSARAPAGLLQAGRSRPAHPFNAEEVTDVRRVAAVLSLLMIVVASPAFAQGETPFTWQRFTAAQQENRPILIHIAAS